jgi:sugar lactone lactonase YvrE
MFWSDWGDNARIERAWMDGTNRDVIVSTDLGWPNGLAIDTAEKRIYWCDAKLDRIESSNYNGSDRRVVLDDVLPHPFGLTLLGDFIYWTDWHEHVVQRADKVRKHSRGNKIPHLSDSRGSYEYPH